MKLATVLGAYWRNRRMVTGPLVVWITATGSGLFFSAASRAAASAAAFFLQFGQSFSFVVEKGPAESRCRCGVESSAEPVDADGLLGPPVVASGFCKTG